VCKTDRDSVEKYEIQEYARQSKLFATTAFLLPGWFMENSFSSWAADFYGGFATKIDEEGYLTIKLPPWGNSPEQVPFIAVADDYGDLVHAVFLEPENWDDQVIQAISDLGSFEDMAQAFTEGMCQLFSTTEKLPMRMLIFGSFKYPHTFLCYSYSVIPVVKMDSNFYYIHLVTGLKARRVTSSIKDSFVNRDEPRLEQEHRAMFDFLHANDGKYYAPQFNDIAKSRQMKKITSDALGRSENEAQLMTLKRFYEKYAIQNSISRN
jgi:hypothetical protein